MTREVIKKLLKAYTKELDTFRLQKEKMYSILESFDEDDDENLILSNFEVYWSFKVAEEDIARKLSHLNVLNFVYE